MATRRHSCLLLTSAIPVVFPGRRPGSDYERLTSRWRRVASYALVLSQIGVSSSAGTALLAGRGILALFGALLAAMLCGFLIYEFMLYRKRRGVPCGCFGGEIRLPGFQLAEPRSWRRRLQWVFRLS
ncbi:MauE/DoxX family redox-associated membrane protein [Phytoactinopolyspora mesophila]|uniref:MauE/DoxX family redox-associated membrane protein n=1 Tax=Phytoactinopolyspora mesophila TaxID=2650750 RepID=UPI003CCDACB3